MKKIKERRLKMSSQENYCWLAEGINDRSIQNTSVKLFDKTIVMHFVTSHKGLEKCTERLVKNTRPSRGEKGPGGVERTSPNSKRARRQAAHS